MEQSLITNWFLKATESATLDFHIESCANICSVHPTPFCPLLVEPIDYDDGVQSINARIMISEKDANVCEFLASLANVSKCPNELAGVLSGVLGMGFMAGKYGLDFFNVGHKYIVRHASGNPIEWKNLLYETQISPTQHLLLLLVKNKKQSGLILVTNRISLCTIAADYFGNIISAARIPMSIQSNKFRFGIGLLGNEYLNHYSSEIERFVFATIPTAGYVIGHNASATDNAKSDQRAVLAV